MKVVPSPAVPVSEEFCCRLIAFFLRQPDSAPFRSSIWDGIYPQHDQIETALREEDPVRLGELLGRCYDAHIMLGIDHDNTEPHEQYIQNWNRALSGLAYNLGALRLPNAEQPFEQPNLTTKTLLAECEKRLGRRIAHPGGGGMPGLKVGDRFVPFGLLPAASRMGSLLRTHDRPLGKVLEIGTGAGFLPYLIHPYAAEYHVIDLPFVAVLHAYLLNCGGVNIWLSGEEPNGATVRLHGLRVEGVTAPLDLFININSLPEIPPAVAHDYLSFVEVALRPGGKFYSLNQESTCGGQERVVDMMRSFPLLRHKYRAPCWGNQDYVEEWWEKR